MPALIDEAELSDIALVERNVTCDAFTFVRLLVEEHTRLVVIVLLGLLYFYEVEVL